MVLAYHWPPRAVGTFLSFSSAIAEGASVKAVQTMLGHASAVETFDTYAALWPDQLDEVADRVSKGRVEALNPKPAEVDEEPEEAVAA